MPGNLLLYPALGLAVLAFGALAFVVIGKAMQAAKGATQEEERCFYCGSIAVRRSITRGWLDPLMAMFKCQPYRCEMCKMRQYRLP